MKEYNRIYFNKNDVAAGLHLKFVNFLLSNLETSDYRVDVHIFTEDCDAIVVEFARQLWDCIDDMGKFEFVNGDEAVVKEVILPDNTFTYADSEEEAKSLIDDWYKARKKVKDKE